MKKQLIYVNKKIGIKQYNALVALGYVVVLVG